jgi:small subunit ribosomal protein S8e
MERFLNKLKFMWCKMAISQLRSKRTKTGSRYTSSRKKKLYELGSLPTLTKVGTKKVSTVRVTGANQKKKLFSTEEANLYDAKSKKYLKTKIVSVKENPANRNFTRRNIITKGTLIETEKGTAKVTNRPGQDGIINAVLV